LSKTLEKNVTLDTKQFNAGPSLIEALFAGSIDIGYVGPNPAINGYIQSKGQALRINSRCIQWRSTLHSTARSEYKDRQRSERQEGRQSTIWEGHRISRYANYIVKKWFADER